MNITNSISVLTDTDSTWYLFDKADAHYNTFRQMFYYLNNIQQYDFHCMKFHCNTNINLTQFLFNTVINIDMQ